MILPDSKFRFWNRAWLCPPRSPGTRERKLGAMVG